VRRNTDKSKPKITKPTTFDEKLKDFLDEDYNKVYYIVHNGDKELKFKNHSNEKCKEAKHISLFSYYDTDIENMKAIL